jgi:hydrogenase nickel incorporation protein HypA/HybF
VHELSLCGAVADITARRAEGRPVATIHLTVGQLRQVVPDSLLFCWMMVTEGTELEGSVLDLDPVAARLRCRACDIDFAMPWPPAFACPSCGGLNVAVVAGEEFEVTALDFAGV